MIEAGPMTEPTLEMLGTVDELGVYVGCLLCDFRAYGAVRSNPTKGALVEHWQARHKHQYDELADNPDNPSLGTVEPKPLIVGAPVEAPLVSLDISTEPEKRLGLITRILGFLAKQAR